MTQKLRILHCVLDEKFIDSMIELTQQLWTGCNHHYVCFRAKDLDFNFIKKTDRNGGTGTYFTNNRSQQ